MAMSPKRAAFEAVTAALKSSGDAWGQQVRLNNGDTSWSYPYVVIVFSGGNEGNFNRRKSSDAEIVLAVKAISDNMQQAIDCDERIADILNDAGVQDKTTGYLNGGANWYILNSTREDFISYEERISATSAIYHEGARYRFVMEAV